MIDFHNHVLPDVDDGPKTIEESMDMLRHASDQGITEIVQTVHFQHPKMDGKNVNYDYLINKIKELQDKIVKEKINIKLHLSAEVFYLPNLVKISKNPLVTIGNGKYMLIEFSTNIFPENYENEFFKIQTLGITPIVAHPERYRFIHQDVSLLDMWLERGFIIQLDAGSILGGFGKQTQQIATKILESNYVHLIGSDAHNSKKRNFCISDAYKYLNNKYVSNGVSQLKKNAESILKGNNNVECVNFKRIKKSIRISDKVLKLLGL